MSGSAFARNQLLKHGWTEGSGLGKNENGIKEAIKVKIKNDTTGVGHNPGKEFTFHWWDHVFNKAASKIDVETTEDGVKVKKKSVASMKETKTFDNKNMLYSRFVKRAVLDPTQVQTVEVSCHDDTDTDEEDDDASKSISKLTEEELFASCEGRTAHKGARHGLKQNAKLLRIQQQEKLYLEQLRAKANKNGVDSLANHSKHKEQCLVTTNGNSAPDSSGANQKQSCQQTLVEEDITELTVQFESTKRKKRKKKKKKKKKKDFVDAEVKFPDTESDIKRTENTEDNKSELVENEQAPRKKRKNKKRKYSDD